MSENNWNQPQKTPKLERVELTELIPLEIPDYVLDRIKYLCKHIPAVEWSGILFYTVEGSIRNPETMKIILQDVLLMSIDTAAATSFEWENDSIIDYYEQHPEAFDWIKGHIHSHNTMGVFFSGTDWSELNDNSPNFNVYLSLIVNNYGDIKAKVAFVGKPKTYICLDETGEPYNLDVEGHNAPVMFVMDCKFEGREDVITVTEEFSNRLAEIKKRCQERDEAKKASQIKNPAVVGGQQTSKDYQNSNHYYYGGRVASQSEVKKTQGLLSGDWGEPRYHKERDIADDVTEELEKFACCLLRLGTELRSDNLTEVLNDLENYAINVESLVDSIKRNYKSIYEKFFQDATETEFLEDLGQVITMIEEYNIDFPSLAQPICDELNSMGKELYKKGVYHE